MIMKVKIKFYVISIVYLYVLVHGSLGNDDDLYGVLGVGRKADLKEIKRAYKTLAKEWHPDRNSHPSAGDKFMKINEAYETLSNEEKRNEYDMYGTTTGRNQQGGGGDQYGHGNPFFGNFRFNFQSDHNDKHRITIRTYEKSVLPESATKPFLVYAYTDFCFQCMQVMPIWQQMVSDLEKIGMGAGTVNANQDMSLSHRLHLNSVPAVIGVINGKLHYFSKPFSISNMRDFTRSILPSGLVTEVTEKGLQEFLGSWTDNRVRMLMFDTRRQPCLRYLLAAFTFRERVVAGYVNVGRLSTGVLSKYKISAGQENILIFNEDTNEPAAHISMQSISRSTMDEIISANKYLLLPRLSSPAMFNHLCPPQSAVRHKKLCILLLTRDIRGDDAYRDSFRDYVRLRRDKDTAGDRVTFGYVYEDAQSAFVNSLTLGQGIKNETLGTLKVAVVWRKESSRLQVDYLEDGWYSKQQPLVSRESCQYKLSQLIDWRLGSGDILPFSVDLLHELNDEHLENLLVRLKQRIFDIYDLIWEKIYGFDEVAIGVIVMTAVFVIVIGLCMANMGPADPPRPNRPPPQNRPAPPARGQQRETPDPDVPEKSRNMTIVPLIPDRYDTLITNSPSGLLLILVMVDGNSQQMLLERFASIAYPHSRTGRMKFSFLRLDEYGIWYRNLLRSTTEFSRSNFDNKNLHLQSCVGTVLAINGPKRYYHIFSNNMDPFQGKGAGQQTDRGRLARKRGTNNDPGFLGFDGEDQVDLEELFHGLTDWLDRLGDGSLVRYHVPHWPDTISDS